MPPTAAADRPDIYFNDEDFIRPDPARGTIRDAVGRRLVRASADLLAALLAALAKEGADAEDVLYKLGRQWGEADFNAFAERAPREFGVASLEQMHFQVMLEAWRWPLTAAGWGTWRYDFRRARVGLPSSNCLIRRLCPRSLTGGISRHVTSTPACSRPCSVTSRSANCTGIELAVRRDGGGLAAASSSRPPPEGRDGGPVAGHRALLCRRDSRHSASPDATDRTPGERANDGRPRWPSPKPSASPRCWPS